MGITLMEKKPEAGKLYRTTNDFVYSSMPYEEWFQSRAKEHGKPGDIIMVISIGAARVNDNAITYSCLYRGNIIWFDMGSFFSYFDEIL